MNWGLETLRYVTQAFQLRVDSGQIGIQEQRRDAPGLALDRVSPWLCVIGGIYQARSAQQSIEMTGSFTIHHIGIAVPDMEQAIAFYADALGLKLVQGPFEDPIQKVKVCFLAGTEGGWGHIELITPLNEESPVNNYLKRDVGAYHVCYEVANIVETLAELRKKGCLTIARPVPAVAFSGRKIAWCCTPTQQLVELLEKETAV